MRLKKLDGGEILVLRKVNLAILFVKSLRRPLPLPSVGLNVLEGRLLPRESPPYRLTFKDFCYHALRVSWSFMSTGNHFPAASFDQSLRRTFCSLARCLRNIKYMVL